MPTLADLIHWTRLPIPGTAAPGTLTLGIGDAGSAGPAALITAGVHGDEGPWGARAIQHLLTSVDASRLIGRLRVIPVANPLAMDADARNAPVDQLDLNRAFPGDAAGSYTERLAALLVERGLAGIDTAIDLHGGGSWCVNSFVFEMEDSTALAAAFDAPFVVKAPDRSVTLTGWARSQGARVVAVEMGGRSANEEQWARHIASGLEQVLVAAGVLSPSATLPERRYANRAVSATSVLRPSRGGVFVPALGADAVGTVVPQGTLLGTLIDPITQATVETFTAPFAQTAILLLRPMLARIEGGAMTYVIAEPV
jgi:predicted deacylase